MASTEERLEAVERALDRTIDRGLEGETYNGHAQQFIAPSELVRAEQHLRKRAAAEGSRRGGGFGRRILASFNS